MNDGSDQEVTQSGAGDSYKKKKLSSITTFYSLPWSSGDFYVEGATSVIYDSSGSNPAYYKNPYKIFTGNGVQIIDVEWKIQYYALNTSTNSFDPVSNNVSFCENYLPVLNDKNVLSPCATYVDDGEAEIDYYAFIQCYNTPSSGQKRMIWSQPIIVRKNRYEADMDNAVDSSLVINLDTGSIISSLMSAFRRGG